MKRIKILGAAAVILLLCVVGEFWNSYAASAKGAANGTIKVFEEKRKQLPSVRRIEADLDYIDFKITYTKERKSGLSYSIYCKNSKNPFQYHVNNGVLYLKEKGVKGLSNEERKQKFGKNWWKYHPNVTLYLPAKTGIKNINVAKGDLLIGKKVRFSDMDIQMNGGDMVISGLTVSGTTRINLNEGDIVVKDLTVPGNVQITAKEGDIVVKDLTVSGNVQITAKEGDMLANDLKVSGKLLLTSGEGDILVAKIGKKYFDAMTITADALDGDMLVLGDMKAGKVKRKGYGCFYKKNGTGKGKLKITAKEGDILLK